jgi:hypothetical protein
MKYSKRTVDEAVQLLDCYASQAGWPETEYYPGQSLGMVFYDAQLPVEAIGLANRAFDSVPVRHPLRYVALEAAQRLREGWRP